MRFINIIYSLLFFLCYVNLSYSQNILSENQWEDDFSYMIDFMQITHPDLFFTISEKFFKQEADSLYQIIPHLTDNEVKVELLRFVASIKDWHTRILGSHITSLWFPVRIEKFSDGFFVTAISKKYSEILGAKVLQIGEFTSIEAFEKVKSLNSHDNKYSQEYFAPLFLTMSSVLNGLHIISGEIEVPLIIEQNGKQKRVNIKSIEYNSDDFFSWYWEKNSAPCEEYISILNSNQDKLPMYLQNNNKPYWFKHIPAHETLYMCFNQCTNNDDEKFIDFTERICTFIANNHVQYLVIDMRNNLGGTDSYLLPFIHNIIKNDIINQKGHLYIIIGRKNVSAAVHFISWIEKHCNPILVGEPTGAPPNHYADAEFTQLPNSKLQLMVSKWYWMTARYPWDNRKWIEPEINIELTAHDYFNFYDPILDGILKRINDNKSK
jgi:hypothetical protein